MEIRNKILAEINDKTPNPNQPDFVKDIVKPNSSIPLDINLEEITKNPYTVTIPGGFQSDPQLKGTIDKPGFFETAGAEFAEWDNTYQALHARYNEFEKVNPLDDIAPSGWTPKTDVNKFINIPVKDLNYLYSATGPKDQDYRIKRIYQEQAHDETLANGSFFAKLLGGVAGAIVDPINLIPIAGWAKYAKFAPTAIRAMMRAAPGATAYGILSSAAEQSNKINGNLQDFVTNAFVSSVFGTAIFGLGGVVGLSADKMQLWNLNKFAKETLDGIDFKLLADEKGKLIGYKAFDKSGTGLSADRVTFAQDLANSSFAKMGVFKIPYVNTAFEKTFGNPFFGTPLIRMLNSTSKVVRGVIDRVADHSIITTGVKEGEEAPQKFASLLSQTFASVRDLQAQITSLRLERNGFNIKNRALGGIVNLGLNLQDKTLKVLTKDLEKTGYVTPEEFSSEIRQVLTSKTPSQHASVNEAAGLMRKHIDGIWEDHKKAYGLKDNWMPKEVFEGFISRVYDTPHLAVNEDQWINVIGGWLEQADETIKSRMAPIKDIEDQISRHLENHENLITRPKITNEEIKTSSDKLMGMKARKKALEESLQNDIRNNIGDHFYHVDDWNALSADEAKQIISFTKKRDGLQKEVDAQQKIVSKLKSQTSKLKAGSIKAKTAITSKANKEKSEIGQLLIADEEAKLKELTDKLDTEKQELQDMMHSGKVDNRLFTKKPNSFQYEFKDHNNRLKLRELYGSEKNPITARQHAKAYYDTIMNQTAEDTINQVMGRVRGDQRENPIKSRTLLVPDSLLYENNFMSKDLMASVSNYTNYLARRTHLKNVFNDVTIDGGFEPIIEQLNAEHEATRKILNQRKTELQNQNTLDISDAERIAIHKNIKSVEKELMKAKKRFETHKSDLNHIYEKMMGISNQSLKSRKWQRGIMAFTAMANLPFVPFTMINDLSAIALKHGLWPFIRDGVEPIIESMGGIIKTADSEAFRKSAPSVHLALQDVLNGYADRNWSSLNNPYLNMGKIVNSLEWLAHASTNFTGTNYIDNLLQRITGATVQSELMRILHAYKAGKMSDAEGIYIRKYGLNPKEWSDKMIAAFEQSGGGKTKLGGYRSNFWLWKDMDASNEFSSAVFRGIKDTQIQAGIADSPFWTDSPLGSIIKGFLGWTFASLNRYVIPSLQQPDARTLIGVTSMLATGALVSPLRRMARGEDPYPPNMTDEQWLWQTVQDSGYFSWFMEPIAMANILSGDKLLGNLKNDRYTDRTRSGLLGPTWGTANRMADIIDAIASGEWNEADAKKAARMIPFANATWTYWMSQKVIEGLNLPKTRAQAR